MLSGFISMLLPTLQCYSKTKSLLVRHLF
jgi:hypothetical protein